MLHYPTIPPFCHIAVVQRGDVMGDGEIFDLNGEEGLCCSGLLLTEFSFLWPSDQTYWDYTCPYYMIHSISSTCSNVISNHGMTYMVYSGR
jgi:hypothetical protein